MIKKTGLFFIICLLSTISAKETCPLIITNYKIVTNPVNTPILYLTVKNESENEIDEFIFTTECYDKYDKPVTWYNSNTNIYRGVMMKFLLPGAKNLPYKIEKYDCKVEWVGKSWKEKKNVCKEKKIFIHVNQKAFNFALNGFDGTTILKNIKIIRIHFKDGKVWEE